MSWPEAVTLSVAAVCMVSFMIGKWPWERDNIYTCDCQCDSCTGVEPKNK